jgi:formylglycine-generating enzyme required for sulfatase activity
MNPLNCRWRVAPAVLLLLLAGCEREPEQPVTPPPTPKTVQPLPAPPPEPVVAAEAPVEAPVVAAPKKVAHPRVAALPQGFVRVAAGDFTDTTGQRLRTPAFAIAKQPVTVAQLLRWAESEEGRRLPQLNGNPAGDTVVTDLDWMAADAYARWLSKTEKRSYRLPSELEWLRAAQSGRIDTQAQRLPAEPPLWEWTADCWNDGSLQAPTDAPVPARCASRILVGGEYDASSAWGRAPMGERRPAASFRLVLELQ